MKATCFALRFLVSLCFAQGAFSLEEAAELRERVLALGELRQAPATMPAEGFETSEGIAPIFIDTLDYEGKPSKVFAWLGIPQGRSGKVPGIVLVHGGGGTAFREWVKKWNDHGFAAVAFAHEGQVERRDENRKWEKHAWAGPWRRGHYKDVDKPLQDQWMYHAVADTVLANSLLRSLPEVDADQIGVMGVSWGGVITSTVMGIDDRFAFAIPTYGCGMMADVDNHWGKALGDNEFYREVWDPLHYLPRAKMPTLWFSWPNDKHFPLDSQAASYQAMAGPYMVSLLPGMKHSTSASYNPPDSYAFAKSVVSAGKPWCMQVGEQVEGQDWEVVFDSSKALDRAVLIWTKDRGYPGDRHWEESAAELQRRDGKWVVSARVPEGATGCFVNLNSGELTASSNFRNLEN